MMKAKANKNLGEIIKFSIIGVLNTFIDFFIFYLIVAYTPLDTSIAKIISVSIAMTNSYFINRYFTFKKTGAVRFDEMIKFILINLLSAGLSIILIKLFYDFIHIENLVNNYLAELNIPFILDDPKAKLFANILATPFVLAVNFIGNKFWVFKSKERK